MSWQSGGGGGRGGRRTAAGVMDGKNTGADLSLGLELEPSWEKCCTFEQNVMDERLLWS